MTRAAPPERSRVCSCGRSFGSFELRVAHQRDDHTSPTAVSCQQCGHLYGTQGGLNRHLTKSHPSGVVSESPATGTGPLGCESCGARTDLATEMHEHTMRKHRRRPTVKERTPHAVPVPDQ